jgi:putative drug exporter of the RND superfamily
VRVVKEFAVGASLAVLIDATIIRVLLVPALMALLGEANWWAPRFLRGRRPQAEPAAL